MQLKFDEKDAHRAYDEWGCKVVDERDTLRADVAAWKSAALKTSLVSAAIPTNTPADYEREQSKAACKLITEVERLRAELAAAKGGDHAG